MVQRALATAVIAMLLVAAPAAARSVYDPDIGWPPAKRHALHLPIVHSRPCHREPTRAMVHLQGIVDKRGNPLEAIRARMRYRWGNAWYDPCDGGRLGIGIQAAGARYVPAVRAIIARRHLTRQVRLFAVRSTYRQLSDAQLALEAAYRPLLDREVMSTGLDPTRNTVLVELASPVTREDRARIRASALAAPVNVVVHDVPVSDFSTVPL